MKNLDKLHAFSIPVKQFRSYAIYANKQNEKFNPSLLGKTQKTFFREVERDGEKHLVLKLSERPIPDAKPSKNILKRWNLANGMLYFFYSLLGLRSPPSPEEILEPFHAQKRIDFVFRCCMAPTVVDSKRRAGSRAIPKAFLTLEDLKVEVPHDADALTDYLRLCDRDLANKVSDIQVKAAVEDEVWTWDPNGYWLPNLGVVEQWSFENGIFQIFSRAVRMRWSSMKSVWDTWNSELGHNATMYVALFLHNPTDPVDRFFKYQEMGNGDAVKAEMNGNGRPENGVGHGEEFEGTFEIFQGLENGNNQDYVAETSETLEKSFKNLAPKWPNSLDSNGLDLDV